MVESFSSPLLIPSFLFDLGTGGKEEKLFKV